MFALERVYGERLFYHNFDPEYLYSSSIDEVEQNYDIVHGHIDLTRAAHFITDETFVFTFLRDPVQRVISSYYFHARPEVQNPLATKVREEKMSLKEFADLPDQQNLQTEMIRPIGKERVNFFGIYEDFNNSIKKLGQFLSVSIDSNITSNVNPDKEIGRDYSIDFDTHKFILERNMQDFSFYRWVKQNMSPNNASNDL